MDNESNKKIKSMDKRKKAVFLFITDLLTSQVVMER